MDEQQALEKVAEQYRRDGYEVLIRPQGADLPPFLANARIDILARDGRENVVVGVKRRDELEDDLAVAYLASKVNAEPGWRFDLFVVNPRTWLDELPREASEPSIEEINALADQADRLLDSGAVGAGLVIAWSGVEAAMRAVARRENIDLERKWPLVVLKTLYSNGLVSREEYDRLRECFRIRNAVAHGLRSPQLQPDDVQFLIQFAKHFLRSEPAQADR